MARKARLITIVGGGYAGALCAVRLARKTRASDVDIVLVDARPWFVERIRLHQDVAGSGPRRRSIASLLEGTRVRLRVGLVRAIDLERRRLYLEGPAGDGAAAEQAFDELVLATGSVAATSSLPGIEHAWSCATEERALELRDRVAGGGARRVVVVGGGLTGIELATELAEGRSDTRVTLVASGEIGVMLGDTARAHIRAAFAKGRIDLRENARVVAIEDDGVVLASGDMVQSDATVWCGGFEATPLARAAGLHVDELGRAFVDGRLRSTSHAFVHVVGDAARVDIRGRDGTLAPLQMACATAVPLGAFAADDIAREIRGREARDFSFGYPGHCVSIGRHDAVIQLADSYDAPRFWFGGRVGAFTKEMICRHPLASIGLDRRGFGYSWRKAPALPEPERALLTRNP